MEAQEVSEIEARKLLLDFYASELGTHSRLIVGFSIILFTFLQIMLKTENGLDRSIFGVRFILYAGTFAISLALWYLFQRHFIYGVLADACIHTILSDDQRASLIEIDRAIGQFALGQKIYLVLPCSWFMVGGRWKGLLICIIFALVTTFLLMWLVDNEFVVNLFARFF